MRVAAFPLAIGLLALIPLLAPQRTAAETLGTYDSAEHRFRVVKLIAGLEHPWSLAFLPDGRILVTERPGRLRIVAGGALAPEPVAGVPEVLARALSGETMLSW